MIRNILRYALWVLTISLIAACSTEKHIFPRFDRLENIKPVVAGAVDYTGNKEYLPRTIRDAAPNDPQLVIKYRYAVSYGNETGPEVVNLFNPFLFAGFPIGQDTLAVVGKLDIIRRNEVIKSYSAACMYEKTRSLFYQGPTFSELRREGLLDVRDNIEAQTYRDRESLAELNGRTKPENKTTGEAK